jgi:Terminase large subunit, T4likevirus-type, N-terminal
MIATDMAIALDPALLMGLAGMPPDPWQVAVMRSAAKRRLLNCSRQSGKSSVTSCLAVYEAIYRAPSLTLLLSPTQRQSGLLFRKCKDVIAALGQALGKPVPVAQESALQMELQNGSQIVSLPGKEETIRGYSSVSLLVIDEAARVSDDLVSSVRPMLAVSGGQLIMLSTPWGKRGTFFEAWENGIEWERTRITALDVPRISPEFLEEERRGIGDYFFDQEYMCIFRETSDQVFTHEEIEGMANDDLKPMFSQEMFG